MFYNGTVRCNSYNGVMAIKMVSTVHSILSKILPLFTEMSAAAADGISTYSLCVFKGLCAGKLRNNSATKKKAYPCICREM